MSKFQSKLTEQERSLHAVRKWHRHQQHRALIQNDVHAYERHSDILTALLKQINSLRG